MAPADAADTMLRFDADACRLCCYADSLRYDY